jgi:hypothetical protein
MDNDLPAKPDVTFEFNLPHGIDISEDSLEDGQLHDASKAVSLDVQAIDEQFDDYVAMENISNDRRMLAKDSNDDITVHDNQELNYHQFSPGFSDDEGSGEAFERSWPSHQANKQAARAAKGKKSPRRSDNESEDSEMNIRAKKPRQSLFGGADQELEIDEQVDNLLTPATPGLGLGNRMSSLTLDQQKHGDGVARPMNNGFGLACSDIGSVRDSPAPSDDEFVIPPDTVVSLLDLPYSPAISNDLSAALLPAAAEHRSSEGCHTRRYRQVRQL